MKRASRPPVTKAFNDYARRVGALKEKDNNLSGDDFREGMTAVLTPCVQKSAVRGPDQGPAGQHARCVRSSRPSGLEQLD